MKPNDWVPLAVALGVAFSTGPFSVWLTTRGRRTDKLEDWRRQDEVAARAKADAEKVAQAAKLLQETNEIQVRQAAAASAAAAQTAAKLDEIQRMNIANHLLLNSNLTAQMQIQLELHRSLEASLRREIALTEAAGRPVGRGTFAELKSSQDKIAELEPMIADRLAQTVIADAEISRKV